MRDSQIQTPQRDQASSNRRPKSTPDPIRNARKVTRKSLNPVFKTVSEEETEIVESPKEFAEVFDGNPFAESVENFIASIPPVNASPSETVPISDMTSHSLSSSTTTITSDKHVLVDDLPKKSDDPEEVSPEKRESIQAEMVIKHLKKARSEVLRLRGASQLKKLLDALTNVIIEELSVGLPEENDWFDKIVSSKAILGLLTGVPAIILGIVMFWCFSRGAAAMFSGPPPT